MHTLIMMACIADRSRLHNLLYDCKGFKLYMYVYSYTIKLVLSTESAAVVVMLRLSM